MDSATRRFAYTHSWSTLPQVTKLQLKDVNFMHPAESPSVALARRLKELRTRHWPDLPLTQAQLAEAFSTVQPVSVPSISSWESTRRPVPPPYERLRAYAAFFATRRSVAAEPYRVLADTELTGDERAARDRLHEELLGLREVDAHEPDTGLAWLATGGDTIGGGPWHFPDARPVTIVCARLPEGMLARMPYTEPTDPDYVESYTYADLDALIELHGYLRAVNPTVEVNIRTADNLTGDDYTAHLVLLGGVDWNPVTRDLMRRLNTPVRQVSRAGPGDQYDSFFEVPTDNGKRRFDPVVESEPGSPQGTVRRLLRQDVAHFVRGDNPYNSKRTLTICNGMFGRGTYGAVRALTDHRFRDRNGDYLARGLGPHSVWSLLFRIFIVNGETLTPDWTDPGTRLHEWTPTGG